MLTITLAGTVYDIKHTELSNNELMKFCTDTGNAAGATNTIFEAGELVFNASSAIDITDAELTLDDETLELGSIARTLILSDTDEWIANGQLIQVSSTPGTTTIEVNNCSEESFDISKLQFNYADIEYQGHINHWLKLLVSATYDGIPCEVNTSTSTYGEKTRSTTLSCGIVEGDTVVDSILLYKFDPYKEILFIEKNFKLKHLEEEAQSV